MKKSVSFRIIALFLCLILTVSVIWLPVSAVEFDEQQLNYYQLISKRDWELAPGITESEIILNNAAGNKRQVSHVVEIDIHDPNTKVIPSTYKMAEGLQNKDYRTQTMSAQAKYAEEHGYGNVVAAMNTTLHWYDTDYYLQHPELIGEPLGTLVLDGVKYTNSQNSYFGAYTCLVINFDEKDGVSRPETIPKTEIRQTYDPITGWEEQVIPANFHFLVKNGVSEHVINDPTEPAPRSFMGIKADGTIILVMNEGRNEPYSTGFNCYEMAEFMISLGCVHAINCDGGGSSTFLSQRPGEELKLHCSPSDGSERPVTNGVLVISTASDAFAEAVVSADGDYYTPGSTVQFTAEGYAASGKPADLPSNAIWQLADSSFGTIENGLFVSNGKEGMITVQLTVDGIVVGEDTISIVKPDVLSFASETIEVSAGGSIKLALNASYQGNQVLLMESEPVFSLSAAIGTFHGMYFMANENAASAQAVLTATVCGISATTELLVSGHTYRVSLDNQKIVCDCGCEFTKTGLQTLDGQTYYTVDGNLKSGWIAADEVWYYFDQTSFAGVHGVYTTEDNVRFTFDNGRLTKGTWTRNSQGYRYWIGPNYYRDRSSDAGSSTPYEIDGKTYLFNKNGYLQTGVAYFYDGNGAARYYDCGADGVATLLTGFYQEYFYQNGVMQKAYQLVEFEGDYYFINDYHKPFKNGTIELAERFTSKFDLPAGRYTFDASGKMVINHGVVGDYLYINGVLQKAYQLIEFEGCYYFVNDHNKLLKNATIDLGTRFTSQYGLPAGRYAFDAEGKLVINHGVVGDYLYINGVMQKAYQLVEFEGAYYFVNDYNKLLKNATISLNEKFTSPYGIPAGRYAFDAEGKLVINHGVVGDYLYINGVMQKAYQLLEFEGAYYFVNDYNKLVKNGSVDLSSRFTSQYGLPAGRYAFDAEGKLVINHGVVGDYLYINGHLQKAYQLIEFEGNYYFINDYNKLLKNATISLSEKFTGAYGIPAGRYAFDANGRMVINHGIVGDQLYINGVLQKAYQLIKFEDSYYFVNDYNKLLKNATIDLSARFTSQYDLPAGRYAFDADGKMIINHGVVGDYLYINGQLQKAYQLIEFEGDYYFISDYNKLLKNARIHLSKRFVESVTLPDGVMLEADYYRFDANGKMVLN